MLLVGGGVIEVLKQSGETPALQKQRLLAMLLDSPELRALAEDWKARACRRITACDGSANEKFLYVFQKEFATATSDIEFVGTDELTTCIGMAIHNPRTCLTSVGHLDRADEAALGLKQMVHSITQEEDEDILEVHLVGAYDDSLDAKMGQHANVPMVNLNADIQRKEIGYSWPLALNIIHALHSSPYKFDLRMLCILQNNTIMGSNKHFHPIIRGFLMKTKTGIITPASFAPCARSPDKFVRGLRLSIATSDQKWKGGLLETYDTSLDRFVINPFKWSYIWHDYAVELLKLSDTELLEQHSTSPYAESEDFIDEMREKLMYLVKYPDWRHTFPGGRCRVFIRDAGGMWMQQEDTSFTS